MPFGYFGSTSYDKIRIRVEKPTSRIVISLSSESPEYLNLGRIEFFDSMHPDAAIDVFGTEYQGIASLSSKYGDEGVRDATFEIAKGADIHSQREIRPTLTITLRKELKNFTIAISNRADYWGCRSSTLTLKAFRRSDSCSPQQHEEVQSFSLQDHVTAMPAVISKRLFGDPAAASSYSSDNILTSICDALDSGVANLKDKSWPLVMNITNLQSPQADDKDIKVWAAFLISQALACNDCSLLNLLNPSDDSRLERLLGFVDRYARVYNIALDAQSMIFGKAKSFVKDGRWRLGKSLYEILLNIDKNNQDYQFGLAECFDTMKLPDLAKPLYLSALRSRPEFKPEHLEMFDTNQRRIKSRVVMYDFVQSKLGEVRARADKSLSQIDQLSEDKVFCYWAQGFNSPPPIINACQRQLRDFMPGNAVVLLTEENINNYVVIPEHVKAKLSTRSAFFSDILRLLLLSRYGGTWIDATCYLTGKIETTHRAADGPFTAFQVSDPSSISVWYIKSRNDSWIIHAWKEAMLMYWEHHDEEINYFIFHHIFEALYLLDERFRSERNFTKPLPSSVPHEWYFKLADDFDMDKYKKICKASNIHKLTYKTSAHMERAHSFYSYAIRGF